MLGEEPLTATEVAQLIKVGRNKVYELARSGQLGSYHIGRKLRFTIGDVQAYLDAQHSGSLLGAEYRTEQPAYLQGSDLGIAYLSDLVADKADFVVAGVGPAVGLLASGLCDAGLLTAQRSMSGFAALVGLYLGEVDAAVVDLYDAKTNSSNVEFVRRLAPGVSLVDVVLCDRMWGFAVAPGNPKKVTTWGALLREGIRIAQQAPGMGGRVLFDEKVMGMEARAEAIAGYADKAAGELDAAMRVARGECDVAVCAESTSAQVDGVSFVPMQKGRLDLVLRKTQSNRAFVRNAKSIVSSAPFRAELQVATGGNCSKTGSIVLEC